MARKSGSTIVQEELYPPSAPAPRPGLHDLNRHDLNRHDMEMDDARLIDLDVGEESPFLRGQKRVSARRSSIPKKAANRLLWVAVAAVILCCAGLLLAGLYRYGEKSWRFRVESSDDIEITGTENVTKAQIMEVMGADIGRNIFFIPLAQQKAQLEQIPWVQAASVMRFVPNRLQVEIEERTPVAFARVGPRISLIDAGGTLMELPQKHKYSFPVILGMNPGEPLSTRAPRMKAYDELVRDLDADGAHYSQELSEVDLTDLEDVKVRVNDPAGDVLVHLGSSDYLHRYKIYVGHVKEWRQQFQKLESVDLRYDNQIIVNPDMLPAVAQRNGAARQALAPASAKGSRAAGLQQAAMISPVAAANRALPKPVFEMTQSKLNPNGAGADPKKVANGKVKKANAPAKSQKGISAKAGPSKVASSKAVTKKSGSAVHSARGIRNSKQRAAQHSAQAKSAHPSKQNGIQPAARVAGPKPSPAIAKEPEITD
jgi:cell division protein FtsQ